VFKKLVVVFSFSLIASHSFAISDEALAEQCFDKGVEKVLSQAQAWHCEIDTHKIEINEIDNRWYSPSKYIWFQVLTPCNGYDRIVKMVQYYEGRCL
jgi:hypothetical protein